MASKGYYIEGTDWRLLQPRCCRSLLEEFQREIAARIDAWWLDATEPENDDCGDVW